MTASSRAEGPPAVMYTDVGRVRERNEDVAFMDPRGQFFIVADGMGGRAGGDLAAQIAVDTVRQTLEAARQQIAAYAATPSEAGRRAFTALLTFAVRAAHDAIVDRSYFEPDKRGMGTTLEVLLIAGAEAFVAHAGDSRTYLVRGGQAEPITRDHTMAGAMIAAGTYTEAQARAAGLDTVLMNGLGLEADVMVDVIHRALEPGDRLLICSDGLSDHFTTDELSERLVGDAGDVLHALVVAANQRGGHDNITGVVVDVPRPPPPRENPLATLSDEMLGWWVERTLIEEKSGPVRGDKSGPVRADKSGPIRA